MRLAEADDRDRSLHLSLLRAEDEEQILLQAMALRPVSDRAPCVARGALAGLARDLPKRFAEPDEAGHHEWVTAERAAGRIDRRSVFAARVEAERLAKNHLFDGRRRGKLH